MTLNVLSNVVADATCTFCVCVCDDIELHTQGDRIVKARIIAAAAPLPALVEKLA